MSANDLKLCLDFYLTVSFPAPGCRHPAGWQRSPPSSQSRQAAGSDTFPTGNASLFQSKAIRALEWAPGMLTTLIFLSIISYLPSSLFFKSFWTRCLPIQAKSNIYRRCSTLAVLGCVSTFSLKMPFLGAPGCLQLLPFKLPFNAYQA